MAIESVGLRAYTSALQNFNKAQKAASAGSIKPRQPQVSSFSETLGNSLSEVNSLQTEKKAMITSFASGENQNVHELMITMQKAGLAMNLTAAVRNKVIEAYKELSRLQF
jgi:flagellar hook-basal body complex protein FliE